MESRSLCLKVKRTLTGFSRSLSRRRAAGARAWVDVRREWREVKAHLGCYSSFSTCGSFDGVKEHLLANNSHLIDEFFKLSMLVNSSTKKFGLLVGKGDGGGLGFDFSGPAPVALWALAKATLSHPIQG